MNEILNIFKNQAKVSQKNDVGVTQKPFFTNNCINNFIENTTELDSQHILFFNKFPFDKTIKQIYLNVGNNREIDLNKFTFMALDEIIKRQNNYQNFIDLGIYYLGMGHVKVLSMSKQNGKFFFRNDGGSNGYERESNYNLYKNYQPKINELIGFNNAINQILNFN